MQFALAFFLLEQTYTNDLYFTNVCTNCVQTRRNTKQIFYVCANTFSQNFVLEKLGGQTFVTSFVKDFNHFAPNILCV